MLRSTRRMNREARKAKARTEIEILMRRKLLIILVLIRVKSLANHFADCSENKEWTLKYSQMEAILFQEDHIREFFEKQTDIRIEAEKTLRAIIHQK